MSKIRTSVQVEQKFIGEEPTWDKDVISVPRALSWYANQLSSKESKKYTLDYLKENNFDKYLQEKISSVSEDRFLNLGFVCRMEKRGANLNKKEWIEVNFNIPKENTYVVPREDKQKFAKGNKNNII